jgi:hypothetical protein
VEAWTEKVLKRHASFQSLWPLRIPYLQSCIHLTDTYYRALSQSNDGVRCGLRANQFLQTALHHGPGHLVPGCSSMEINLFQPKTLLLTTWLCLHRHWDQSRITSSRCELLCLKKVHNGIFTICMVHQILRITRVLGPVHRPELEKLENTKFLELWTMDKVQDPINSECYTPSSEYFRFNFSSY